MPAEKPILTWRQTGQVRLKCRVRLDRLFPDDKDRERFEQKWAGFVRDDCNAEIYHRQQDTLFYDSEQLLPRRTNQKPSLLLVLGNPAGESVKRGMFFATTKTGRELRIWKHILGRAGLLPLFPDNNLTAAALNQRRKKQLWHLEYDGPVRVGLTVFFSMPGAAGGKWGGVAGIRKLLGARAFRKLEKEETARVLKAARDFVSGNGAVAAFQKNAWNALRSGTDPVYHIDAARDAMLTGTLKNRSDIPLWGVPPTRLVGPCRTVLANLLGKNLI
jgi:hypothetical protein